MRNDGDAAAGPSKLAMWVGRSDGSSDRFMCEIQIPEVPAHSEYFAGGQSTVPDLDLAPGGTVIRHLRADAYADREVDESNEDNNIGISTEQYGITGS